MKKILYIAFVLSLMALLILYQDHVLAQERPPGTPGAPSGPREGRTAREMNPQVFGAPVRRRGDESIISYLIFAMFGGFIVYLAYKGQKR